jgi:hypothetical protein
MQTRGRGSLQIIRTLQSPFQSKVVYIFIMLCCLGEQGDAGSGRKKQSDALIIGLEVISYAKN